MSNKQQDIYRTQMLLAEADKQFATGKVPAKHWRDVKRVDQSPMNPQRWCAELACGHIAWVTGKRRPSVKQLHCAACATEYRSAAPTLESR